ncbi:MAG: ATP-binding protein [Bacteroidia bacterium]|nr:ATP-binding protein [Bacteroidia bacterium]
MSLKILHIDDDEADHYLLKRFLQDNFSDNEVFWVKNKGDFANKIPHNFEPNIIILDYIFNGFTAIDIIPLIKIKFKETPLILLTAFEGPDIKQELVKFGIQEIFFKKELSVFGKFMETYLPKRDKKTKEFDTLLGNKIPELNSISQKQNLLRRLKRRLIFQIPLPILVLDHLYETTTFNKIFLDYFKNHISSVSRFNFKEFIGEKELRKIRSFFEKSKLTQEEPVHFSFQFESDKSLTFTISVQFLKVGEGYYLLTFKPETNQFSPQHIKVQNALKLAENKNFLTPLVSFHSSPVMMLNENFEISMINDAGKEFFSEIFKVKIESVPQKIDTNKLDEYWLKAIKEAFIRNTSLEVKIKELPFQLFLNHQINPNGVNYLMVVAANWSKLKSAIHSNPFYGESMADLSDNISSVVIQFDTKGNIVFASTNVINVTGFSQEELIGKNVEEFKAGVFENDFVKNEIKKLLAEPNSVSVGQGNLRRKDLDFITVFYKAKGVIDFSGELQGIICVFRDITENIKLTESLTLNKEALSLVSKVQQAFILGKNMQESFALLLEGLKSLVSFDTAFILSFDEHNNKPSFLAKYNKTSIVHSFFEVDSMMGKMPNLPDGEISGFNQYQCNTGLTSCLAIPVVFENKLLAVLGLGSEQDHLNKQIGHFLKPIVTLISAIISNDRKAKELSITKDKLAKSKSQLNAIIGSIEDIIFEVNSDLQVEAIWARKEELLFLPKEQIINMPVSWLANQFGLDAISDAVVQVFKDGLSRSIEYHSPLDPDKWFYAKVNMVNGENDKFVCVVISDISIKKQAESEIRKNLERDKELTELRTRFVAMTSHEFRTPLASISTSSELLSLLLENFNIEKSSKVWKYISNIQFGVERMVSLVDDVLFLGKMDSGNMKIEWNQIKLSYELDEILTNLFQVGRISNKPEILVVNEERKVEFDSKILGHIIENLVVNAFKYTINGKQPILELRFEPNNIFISIIDYGIGIPEADQKKLFSQYFRAGNVEDIPGTGLGLAITKKLIDLMGCQIIVESKVNEGTKMIIQINQ